MDGDEDNNFGFDKVIVVGDIANIKSIFSHRYGPKTDFEGYIDKFFTTRPYYFDNNQAVIEALPGILKHIQLDYSLKKIPSPTDEGIGKNRIINKMLTYILTQALEIDKVNLRQIYGLSRSKPHIQNPPVFDKGGIIDFPETARETLFYLHKSLCALIYLFGKDVLIDILDEIKNIKPVGPTSFSFYQLIIEDLSKYSKLSNETKKRKLIRLINWEKN